MAKYCAAGTATIVTVLPAAECIDVAQRIIRADCWAARLRDAHTHQCTRTLYDFIDAPGTPRSRPKSCPQRQRAVDDLKSLVTVDDRRSRTACSNVWAAIWQCTLRCGRTDKRSRRQAISKITPRRRSSKAESARGPC